MEETAIPLRVKNTLILYLDMDDQKTYEATLHNRVNGMIQRGLVQELEHFYKNVPK
jgi:hypothetical protein